MNVSRERARVPSPLPLYGLLWRRAGHVCKYWVKTDGSRGVLTHQHEDGMHSEYVLHRPSSVLLSQAWWATKEKPKRFECYVFLHEKKARKNTCTRLWWLRVPERPQPLAHMSPGHRRRAIDLFIQTVCTWEWCLCDGTIWKHILTFMYYYYYLCRYFLWVTCDICWTVSEITIHWFLLRMKVVRCEPTNQNTRSDTIFTSNNSVSANAWKNENYCLFWLSWLSWMNEIYVWWKWNHFYSL